MYSPRPDIVVSNPPPQVWIVEDNLALAQDYLRMLDDLVGSHPVVILPCLDDAIRAIAKASPDVILLDLSLPDAEGLEGLTRLQEYCPEAAIIIITSIHEQGLAISSLRLGAQDFLFKETLDASVLTRAVRYAFERKQGEERVRSVLSEIDNTVRSTRAIFLSIGPDGRILSVNDMVEEILGYSKEELLGRHITEFVAAGDVDQAREAFRLVVDRGLASLELKLLTKTGEERYFIWHNNQIRHQDQVVRISAIGIDLTERQQAEEQLRISQELLSSTLDVIPAFIAILDYSGKIVVTNRNWREIPVPSNRLIHGCQIGTGYVSHCRETAKDPGPIQDAAKGLLKVLTQDEDVFHADCEFPTGDGSLWFEILCSRFHIAGAFHVLVMFTDITDRKLIENRLRVGEELFSIINNNMVDLLTITGPDGHRFYTSSSYSSLLGYSAQEMKNIRFGEITHPEDAAQLQDQLQAIFTTGYSQGVEYRLRHKDGSYLYFESNGALISESNDDKPQAIVIARNISSRKMAQLERERMEILLHQAQKLESIGQLAAGIAHEINTPTQYIGDNTIFLRDAFLDMSKLVRAYREVFTRIQRGNDATQELKNLESTFDETDMNFLLDEVPKAIQQCLEGVTRVTKIVSAMKEFSHPSGDVRTPTDLNRAIESTATVCRNEWKYVSDLRLELASDLPMVPIYPGEFNQAILNLIINAAHAISDKTTRSDSVKGLITINTIRNEGDVEIRIRDTGTGIPEDIRTRIFDPFFTTKPVGRGTGQGLAIVHSVIVEKHKGSISFESEVGVGTTFILRLPY